MADLFLVYIEKADTRKELGRKRLYFMLMLITYRPERPYNSILCVCVCVGVCLWVFVCANPISRKILLHNLQAKMLLSNQIVGFFD